MRAAAAAAAAVAVVVVAAAAFVVVERFLADEAVFGVAPQLSSSYLLQFSAHARRQSDHLYNRHLAPRRADELGFH